MRQLNSFYIKIIVDSLIAAIFCSKNINKTATEKKNILITKMTKKKTQENG